MRRARAPQRGSAIVPLLVVILVCGGLAASILIPGIADVRAAEASLARERAFQVAESGIDWGLAVVRRSGGVVPASDDVQSVRDLGEFTVSYEDGTSNGIDDDGDGTTDEMDEADFVFLSSTGRSGGQARTIEVVLRRSVQVPEIQSAIQFNVDSPILDLNGNAFVIAGMDHDLDGNEDAALAQKPGIASPAAVADLLSQIALGSRDQIQGEGGSPSIGQIASIDLDTLVEQAKSAASIRLEGGTHAGVSFGEPTRDGVVVVYADSDIRLSGNGSGAGILIVDGDLAISGSFLWQGIIIVRGRVTMTGGGSTKRIIGGMIIGEEITSRVSASEVRVTGTVDFLYSTAAVDLAASNLAVMSVLAWRETATP